MKASSMKRSISIALCLLAFITALTACSGVVLPGNAENSQESSSETSENPPSSSSDDKNARHPFTLLYSPDKDINPMSCTDAYNNALCDLMYESLFTLDDNFAPVQSLAEKYSTEDGITYEFTIKSGVYFHDGTEFTAQDAAYSVRQASYSKKYSKRLSAVESCNPTGAYTFTVVLNKASFMLPSLLDVPIIKDLSVNDAVPAGTGPYMYKDGDSPSLTAFDRYHGGSDLPVSEVLLRDSSLADITAEFTAGTLSALPIDPTGTTEFEIHADHEIRYYNTTALQYIGFNRQSGKAILESADFRRAITYAVDRNALIDEFFDGNAVAAPFGFSPSLSFYNSELEEDTGYSLKSLSSILNSIGFADSDGDTWLEHNGEKVALKLIINSDNSRKVNLARSIADTLRSVGINITLSVLSWNEYLYAIDTGNFDLYYAESQLTADFNLKEILTYGGNINHSGVSDEKYSELIDAYLAAPDDDARKASFESLAQYIKSDSTVIPLILKKYAVLTQRGEILGLKPTYSGILTGFAGCTIK